MNKTMIVAFALASITAFAQTETTTTTTNAMAPAMEQTPVVKSNKKAAKKAQRKQDAKVSKAIAPAIQSPATRQIGEPVAPAASDVKAAEQVMKQEGVVGEGTAPAGSNTATTAELTAPAKKWNVIGSIYGTNDYLSQGDIQFLTSLAVSYKITDAVKLRVKQTFETLTAGPALNEAAGKRAMIDDNNFRPTFADFTVSSTLPGFWKSNSLPISLNYKHIAGDAIYSSEAVGGDYSPYWAFVEGNLSIPYTFTPKWELSIDTQWRNYIQKANRQANRFIVAPTLSYAINDFLSIYQSAGVIISTADGSEFRNTRQRALLATGVGITPVKGLSIDLNVNQDKGYKDTKLAVTDFTPYVPNGTSAETVDAVAYEGTITYTY